MMTNATEAKQKTVALRKHIQSLQTGFYNLETKIEFSRIETQITEIERLLHAPLLENGNANGK